MPIVYGNLAGQHYHQDGTKQMERLVTLICLEVARVKVDEFKIWYDERQDFHHMKFERNGHVADIRYYRVLSVDIDGKSGWCGCPTYNEREFVRNLLEKTETPIEVRA